MPGGVRDVPGLWEFLREQKDVHGEFKEPRFSAKGFYHPNSDRPGTAVASSGFLLEEDPRLFDPAFFGITDIEAETMDASQRKLLEVTYEAFENAGETWESVSGSRVGVFVGDISFDNYVSQTRDWDYGGKYAATGSFPNMLANRLHYVFNLKGPSLLINSACTSAMYALHMAITSMRNGDCDSAIVAGSNWIMDPNCHIAMGKLGALSATSRSHTFDASADGYARGEGFAALYLKTARQAVQDASPIRALIVGTAVNANGRTTGITNPSGPAQEIVIREAYKNAGNLDPSETMLLECHGTGTRVGDPIEVTAAGNVFGPSRSSSYEDRLVVGSVKTNLGHLEGACALPGILKVVAALEAGELPSTVGFKTPNPRIDFDKAKARVVTANEPWPKNKLKRASVTSAGFGGTNGHCIIDHVNNFLPNYVKPGVVTSRLTEDFNCTNVANGHETNGTNGHTDGTNGHTSNGINGHGSNGTNGHTSNGAKGHANGTNGSSIDHSFHHYPVTQVPAKSFEADAATRQMVVLPFSAHNQTSLKANIKALLQALDQHSLADVAYTLAAKRSRFQHRAYCIVDKDKITPTDLTEIGQPKAFSSPQNLRVGFVFTGQGAQWHAMGAELFEYAVFRHTISYLDHILSKLPHPAPWKIADILAGNCEKNLVGTAAVSQTACTALQIGLVDLLASWSVRPAAVVGHSSGEMAAAYAAGYMSAAEAITAAYYRGYAVSFNQQKGAMLAVGFGLEQADEYIRQAGLGEKVRIAAINSGDSITLSGNADSIEDLAAKLTQEGVFNRLLRTGGLAYHSHHMLALGNDYAAAVEGGWQRLEQLHTSSSEDLYPTVPWASSVTPDKEIVSPEQITASYWRSNLESPVRFTAAVSKLLSSEDLNIGALVEIGPHPALKSPLNQIAKSLGKSLPHVASVKRGESAHRSLLELAGTLFALNADVDLVAVNSTDVKGQSSSRRALEHGCTAVDLPPYQYTYGPIKYLESRMSREYRLRSVPRHDLLGSKVPGTSRLSPQWRNMLSLKHLPWLNDHRVPPHVLHPGAAHIVMAMVAAQHAYAEFPDALPITGIILRNVSIKKTLVVPEDDQGIEIVLSMELEDGATAKNPGWARFSIASVVRDSDQWTEHCSGRSKVEVAAFDQAAPINTNMDGRAVDAQAWYKRFADMGLQFGPSFQGYSDIFADPIRNVASAKLALNTTAGMFPGGESSYPIHPASLDLVIRLGLMACNGGQAETASVQLPIHFTQMKFKCGRLQGHDWATGVSRGELRGLRGAYAQLQMLDEAGDVLLDVDNMRFTSLNNEQQSSSDAGRGGKAFSSPYARLVWRPDIRTFSKSQYRTHFDASKERASSLSQVSKLVDLAGHANPNLRILQLGAGGDVDAARTVLNVLVGENKIKRYKEFAITDVSEDRLAVVRASTSEFQDITYATLDIEKDTPQQNFQHSTYDVIFWSNIVQSTATIDKALENSGKLLKPGGKLVLLESTGRNGWEERLRKAGFTSGADLILHNGRDATMILGTRPSPQSGDEAGKKVVHLLHGSQGVPALLNRLSDGFEEQHIPTKVVPFEDVEHALPPNARVVAFLDGENLLFTADQHRLGLFQYLAANTSSMVWITSTGMVKGRSPDGALVSGLLRTLGTENPAGQFLSVDIDSEDFIVDESETTELVRSLIDQETSLQRGQDSGASEVNRELTWQDGSLWTSRIVPDTELRGYDESAGTAAPDDKDLKLMALDSQGPIRAAFGTPGILTSLYFRPYTELWTALPRDWIELKVEAVGLNWKDLGLCSGRFDQNNLSNEFCGIVSKIGPAVNGLEVGDRVYGLGKGHFGNYTRVPAVLAQKLSPDVDPVKAATMPLVYMTAVYAFEYATRLRRGQKVLIQSASGGLGLAAIQVARAKGAEVFVTVGTEEKVRFMVESIGIPATHIFSSRGAADMQRMIRATKNDGFDVILSTAQGDVLYESIKALAPLGHLVDVGRLDVTNSKSIALELFQKSAGFTSFDLGLLVDRDVELGGELMRAVDEHHRAGRIGPIQPLTVSDISQLAQTLLQFSKGTHIGKMVVSYLDPNALVKMHRSVVPAQFDPQARYILVGGLSGLGRSIIRWMCSRGARDLVVWSRSGGNKLSVEASTFVDELTAQGVDLQLVSCDVSNQEQVVSAVQEATADGVAVRGVFNFAVSYQDISFDKVTEKKFHQGIAAKVLGTRNLHEATASLPLDFFVMTSSLGTVYAFPTQSTYMAANNYMDYFARYRRRLGLPATTVSLGFINDLGALTQDAVTVNLFVRAKGQTVTAAQVLRALEPAFVGSGHDHNGPWLGRSQDVLSDANILTGIDPAVLAAMKRDEAKTNRGSASGSVPRWYYDARASLMLRATDDGWRWQAGASGGAGLQEVDDAAAAKSPAAQLRRQFESAMNLLRGGADSKEERGKTVKLVTEAIKGSVAAMLFVDPSTINAADTVADHGIDSLLAAEFRNWLHGAFGKNISMLDLMDARTRIDVLATRIVEDALQG
ncbi:hypothetical protein S7711_00732 [Stachybotrys chartarum IBT 7711]|uniref:Uncharacterized protein n=1 Tax=Stachybotrys chartarum (strain CBS 109288 / IBT 7711) TaxID=1280523 RepID=A0A084B010_STACB|nr:hypothetical protein S7711_00732 [Stachybotrys chartarum IBT 7711]